VRPPGRARRTRSGPRGRRRGDPCSTSSDISRSMFGPSASARRARGRPGRSGARLVARWRARPGPDAPGSPRPPENRYVAAFRLYVMGFFIPPVPTSSLPINEFPVARRPFRAETSGTSLSLKGDPR
jgi:hypothetical protein